MPIISGKKMMAGVDVDVLNRTFTAATAEDAVLFHTDAWIGEDDDKEAISISISPLCESVMDGEATPCPELFLVGKGIKISKGYRVSFVTASNRVLWSGHWNVSKPCMNNRGAGANALQNADDAVKFPRKRWGTGSVQATKEEEPVPAPVEKVAKKSKGVK